MKINIRLLSYIYIIKLTLSLVVSAQEINSIRYEYDNNIKKIEHIKAWAKDLSINNNGEENNEKLFLSLSDSLFFYITEKIFPAWYDTKWGFNGITRIPGEGEIACGSFVIFTLQDAGFNVPTEMYKQPSENIIKNLTLPKYIKRFPNKQTLEKIENWIRSMGEGLYIVGLDIHTGFIIFKDNKLTFCHSSYYNPPLSVVNQDFYEKSPLTDSNYRVIGKILTSEMIEIWLNNKEIKLRYNYFR